jgi:hypothetical protein
MLDDEGKEIDLEKMDEELVLEEGVINKDEIEAKKAADAQAKADKEAVEANVETVEATEDTNTETETAEVEAVEEKVLENEVEV